MSKKLFVGVVVGALVGAAMLLSAPMVWAQAESGSNSDAVSSAESVAVITSTTVVDDSLVGVVAAEPTKMPSRWGLLWRNVKERVVVAATFDPVKKAEKRLQIAEENMKIAQYITEHTSDPKKQDWAQKRVERAEKFMAKVEENKEKWINHPRARASQLLKNAATYQIRREKVLDKMEAGLPANKVEKFKQVRQQALDNSKKFMENLSDKNMPPEVKAHLQTVKTRVLEKRQEVIQRQIEKRTQQNSSSTVVQPTTVTKPAVVPRPVVKKVIGALKTSASTGTATSTVKVLPRPRPVIAPLKQIKKLKQVAPAPIRALNKKLNVSASST